MAISRVRVLDTPGTPPDKEFFLGDMGTSLTEIQGGLRLIGTNPNPKIRKSGAVAKAALASMVLEEGSIRGGEERRIGQVAPKRRTASFCQKNDGGSPWVL